MTTTAYDDQFALHVTQADRHAAAAWAKLQGRNHQAANMRRGSCDTAPLVQAFARHREQATHPSADVAELVEALKEARAALHFHYVEWDGEPEDAVPLQLARAKCDAALAKHRTAAGESA